MTNISKFDADVYSEETFPFTEQEYDAVMAAASDDGWQGYAEWSRAIEESDEIIEESENFIVLASGKIFHKPEPKSNGRFEGIEI